MDDFDDQVAAGSDPPVLHRSNADHSRRPKQSHDGGRNPDAIDQGPNRQNRQRQGDDSSQSHMETQRRPGRWKPKTQAQCQCAEPRDTNQPLKQLDHKFSLVRSADDAKRSSAPRFLLYSINSRYFPTRRFVTTSMSQLRVASSLARAAISWASRQFSRS